LTSRYDSTDDNVSRWRDCLHGRECGKSRLPTATGTFISCALHFCQF